MSDLEHVEAYKPPFRYVAKPYKTHNVIRTERGRLMIFVDGSNLFYTAQMLGIEIDYLKLVDSLVNKDKLIRAYFYAGIDLDNALSIGWQFFMKRSGFKMVTKPLQTLPDGSKKANCDVEMAVDMVTMLDSFDTAIVITGDGDLTYAIQYLVNHGKQVELVGSKMNTKDTLIQAADRFVELECLKTLITKSVREV